MRDEYAESMLKLIKTKSSRHNDVVETEEKSERRRPAQVVDLMEVLKKSLAPPRGRVGATKKNAAKHS